MALQKTKTFPSALTANYWKINNLSLDCASFEMEVELYLYKDAAARQAGKAPADIWCVTLTDCDLEALGDAENPVALAYERLKELPEFADAIDV